MGAKDRKANEYFADNRRFADMCNAVLFGGRTVILPEALEATDTTELLSVLGMDGKEISFQKWRDLLKRVIIKKNQNVYLVLIGAELQSDIHYAMPVKDMVYAGSGRLENDTKRKRNGEQNQNFCQGFTGMTP